MDHIRKGIENQAIGLIPLLLLMLLDNYLPYFLSFVLSIGLGFVCLVLFQFFRKRNSYYFLLIPVTITFLLNSLFLGFQFDFVVYVYLPLILEILFVFVLTLVSCFKQTIFRKIRTISSSISQRTLIRSILNDYFYIAQLAQNFFTLHLFGVLLYSFLPENMQSADIGHFLYRELALWIGCILIFYDQIRVYLIKRELNKEIWLPVLNEKGKVTGRIAYSVSRSLAKRYYHPIVRIVVVYKGMLYLVKQDKNSLFFPEKIDHPFCRFVLFNQTIEKTVHDMIGHVGKKEDLTPHFLIRYTFKNEEVKHLVNLFVLRVQTEESLKQIETQTGKLWTSMQIEENLNSGIFSDYLKDEFEYLQSTVLFVENMNK